MCDVSDFTKKKKETFGEVVSTRFTERQFAAILKEASKNDWTPARWVRETVLAVLQNRPS